MIYRRNPLLMTVMGANPGRRIRRRADDPVDEAIGAAWHRLMSGVQVPILDIPRIFRDVKLEIATGMPLEEAVMRVGERYRVSMNPRRYRKNPSVLASMAGGMAGALVTNALSNPGPSFVVIDSVTGRVGYTKRATGVGSEAIELCSAAAQRLANRTGHSQIVYLDMRGLRVGHEVSVAMARHLGITDEFFPDGMSTGKLPGHPTQHDTPHSSESCNKCAHEAYCSVCRKGLRPNPGRRKSSVNTIRENPGPRGKRKITMTIERFAAWVKAKRDPKMWQAFLKKFRGYEKWTHGAKSRKVTLEWQDVPGMNGLWITYDGGRAPESTYIMPHGVPRKGAWKHPWGTMPEIKHDPEAKVVIQKLRGSSKITDFYHK